MKIRIVKRILLPQHESGTDWGRKRWLIAQRGEKRVFWVPGFVAWAGRGSREYSPGTLYFENTATRRWQTLIHGGEGNRLNRQMLLDAKIDVLLDMGVLSAANLWKPGHSVVIE